MPELSQEYFDKKIENLAIKQDVTAIQKDITDIRSEMATKKDLEKFATKDDIKDFATKDDVEKIVDNAIDNLAEVVNSGFEEQKKYLEKKLDVNERVLKLEGKMEQIAEALRIK